jgi:NCAIR mutase (PurE)-related protein
MTPVELRSLLDAVRDGRIEPAHAHGQLLAALRDQPFEDLGFARVDHHRSVRQGFPEVILGIGQSPEQIATIAARIVDRGQPLLVTRADQEAWRRVHEMIPEATYHEVARTVTVRRPVSPGKGMIVIASAGTSDIPIAEEAAVTADLMGNDIDRIYDIGVAGIHRMLSARDRLSAARVIVVVAGMEGALPSVVAGMVDVPVIAVPTSIGYGASFAGITSLIGMLNSCANGVSVVNIDNGFGAGCIASMINHL